MQLKDAGLRILVYTVNKPRARQSCCAGAWIASVPMRLMDWSELYGPIVFNGISGCGVPADSACRRFSSPATYAADSTTIRITVAV